MARIASRAHIVECEPQVRPLGNRDLVVCVKVTVTAVEAVAKLGQHSIGRRITKTNLSEHFDNLRLPVAVYALPTVALEAEDSQPAVVSIISALGGRTATLVVFTLSLPAVGLAGTANGQFGTSRERAWVQYARVCCRRSRDHASTSTNLVVGGIGRRVRFTLVDRAGPVASFTTTLGCNVRMSSAPTKTASLANRWRSRKRARKCS